MTIADRYLDSFSRGTNDSTVPRPPDLDFEHAVLDLLESHARRERAAIEFYRRVAGESPGRGAVRYLIELILEEEERHHRVFEEMANDIQSFVWEVDVDPKLPTMPSGPNPELLAATRRLLQFEREDAKQLRQLRKLLQRSPKSWLHPLLVDLMVHDTAKHIAILKHVRNRVARG
jgi:hypothetical protein